MSVSELALVVRRTPADGAAASWLWDTGGIEREVGAEELAELGRRYEDFLSAVWDKSADQGRLLDVGRTLGNLFVGDEHTEALRDALRHRARPFTVCWVRDEGILPKGLPWEATMLPGSSRPLLFEPSARGAFEFVREHPEAPSLAERRVEQKCLAAFSRSPSRELLVEAEVDDLRRRFLQRPNFRFRWAIDPGAEELQGRLKNECGLFLFAGHGMFDDGRYRVELKMQPVEIERLLEPLRTSLAEVLVFDCCESGHGGLDSGLPSHLRALSSATCLIGMQGPGNDSISAWLMPSLVERLLLGEPVWSAVSLLRILLYELGSDSWYLPAIHLKRSYRPFRSAAIESYEDAIVKQLEGRTEEYASTLGPHSA